MTPHSTSARAAIDFTSGETSTTSGGGAGGLGVGREGRVSCEVESWLSVAVSAMRWGGACPAPWFGSEMQSMAVRCRWGAGVGISDRWLLKRNTGIANQDGGAVEEHEVKQPQSKVSLPNFQGLIRT